MRKLREEEDFWDLYEETLAESSSNESNLEDPSLDEPSSEEDNLEVDNKRGIIHLKGWETTMDGYN